MIRDIFTNITIITTCLALIGQLSKDYYLKADSPIKVRALVGVSFGIVGIFLMIYSIAVTDIVMMDIRHIAITISAMYGGLISALVTAIIVAIFRVLYFGVNTASIFGVILALLIGLANGFIIKFRTSGLKKISYYESI